MAFLYSANEQAAAMAAANAAADGEKEATYLSHWQTALGINPTLNLYRNASLIWSASVIGSLPIDSASFVVPVNPVVQSIIDGDIDTGDWEFRIENAGNAGVYIGADVTKTGDTDVLALSDDVDDETSMVVGEIAFVAPTLDTETQVISRNDSRVHMWMDPNYTFANQLHGYRLQISDALSGSTVWSVSEPGVIGSGSTYTLSRVTSPYSDGTAFLHRIDPAFPLWGSTQRSQYLQLTRLLDNTVYWLGYEFSIESNWATEAHFTLGDIHHSGGLGPRAPINIGGITGASLGWQVYVAGNYTAADGNATVPTLYTNSSLSAGDRVRLVIRFRVARSWAGAPFIQVWQQVNAGSETQVVDRSDVAIGYVDMNANDCYVKMGLYGSVSTYPVRTTYTKGVVVLREASGTPTITAAEMFNLVRSL